MTKLPSTEDRGKKVEGNHHHEKGEEDAEIIGFIAPCLNEFSISPEAMDQPHGKEPEPDAQDHFAKPGKVVQTDESVTQSTAGSDTRGGLEKEAKTKEIEKRNRRNCRKRNRH